MKATSYTVFLVWLFHQMNLVEKAKSVHRSEEEWLRFLTDKHPGCPNPDTDIEGFAAYWAARDDPSTAARLKSNKNRSKAP